MAAGSSSQRITYVATIERAVKHTAGVRSLFLRLPAESNFSFVPGQFISVAIPLANENRVRPYTVASSPEDGSPLEIVFNLVPGGAGSEYLFARKAGDQLSFTGPFGLFTLDRAPDLETIFAAEGTTIAPIRPMIRRALSQPGAVPLKLLYAARSPSELLYTGEFEAAANRFAHFTYEPILASTAEGSKGGAGRLFDRVKELFVDHDERRDRAFYLCGVGQGVIGLRDLLRKSGYQRRAVQYERW
jgi:ferredoxin-NADP reductase